MNNRAYQYLCIVALAFACIFASCTRTITPGKPNFLFIFIDDLGWTSPSCYGNEHVQTVNIDRLAAEGVKFTDAYVTPQCTPSRASLLTGQHTARNRMWHVIPRYGYPYAKLSEPIYTENLPRETYTLARALQENGYKTALLGKWHLTHNQDGYYTYLFDSAKQYYGFDYVNPMTDPTEYQGMGDKGVTFLTEEAMKFMEQNKDRPFFIYLSHHTIHGPVLAPDSLVNRYLQLGYPEKGVFNATYLAAIDHMDHSVGKLLDRLDELGIADNTVVIFLSDNGGVDREFDNAPLRYGKGSAYEGGIRVPFLIRWPGHIDPGMVSNLPVHVVDLFPTLVELGGGKIREDAILDGLSLVPLLRPATQPPPPQSVKEYGKKDPVPVSTPSENQPDNQPAGSLTTGSSSSTRMFVERALFWYMPLYDTLWGATPAAVIRKGKYKLIWFIGDYIDLEQGGKYIPEVRVELYDLEKDIGETNDLVDSLPGLKDEMIGMLKQWLDEMKVPLPVPNPDFDEAKALERGKN